MSLLQAELFIPWFCYYMPDNILNFTASLIKFSFYNEISLYMNPICPLEHGSLKMHLKSIKYSNSHETTGSILHKDFNNR